MRKEPGPATLLHTYPFHPCKRIRRHHPLLPPSQLPIPSRPPCVPSSPYSQFPAKYPIITDNRFYPFRKIIIEYETMIQMTMITIVVSKPIKADLLSMSQRKPSPSEEEERRRRISLRGSLSIIRLRIIPLLWLTILMIGSIRLGMTLGTVCRTRITKHVERG